MPVKISVLHRELQPLRLTEMIRHREPDCGHKLRDLQAQPFPTTPYTIQRLPFLLMVITNLNGQSPAVDVIPH